MAIANFPEDERPRERLLAQGVGALSDPRIAGDFFTRRSEKQECSRSGARIDWLFR